MAMGRHVKITRAMEAIAHCEHLIREMRPHSTWEQVLLAVNTSYPDSPITLERLMRSVKRLVEEGMMPAELLTPVPSTGRRPRRPNRY